MRAPALAVVLAVLSACSGPHTSNAAADVNAAAAQAQGDIDTYAANSLATASVVRPTVAASPVPRSVVEPKATAAPIAADDARDAADVARTYFALIEQRKFGDAWAMWDDGGQASGMTRRQFADSFVRYADYRAEVGVPGRVDAGAGQRYVEVPVRARGTLAEDGRPFELRGTVTLHRTADIDGATPDQRGWRIRDSALQPRPAQVAARAGETYRCAGATRVSARAGGGRREVTAAAIWYRAEPGAPQPCTGD